MGRDEVDRALARLGAEHEAIETSLLALQDHAGRRLLEGAELTGVTKERWAATEQAITLLWTYFDAYTGRPDDRPRGARPAPLAQPRRPGGADRAAARRRRHRCASAAADAAPRPAGRLSEQFTPGAAGRPDERLVREVAGRDRRRRRRVVRAARPDRPARRRAAAHPLAGALGGVRPGRAPVGRRPGADHRRADRAARRRWSPTRSPSGCRPRGSSAPGGGRPDTARYDRAARALEDVRREIEAVLRRPAGRRAAADAAARRALPRRPHARRGAAGARRGAGEDRRVRGARGQRPADGAAGAAGRRPPSTAGAPSGTGSRRCWRAWSSGPRTNCCAPASR